LNPAAIDSVSLLHSKLRTFIRRQGWDSLRPIQEQAVNAFFRSNDDLIIAAPTSSGKTEAVFLPAISQLLGRSVDSFQLVYVAPLRALINDQYARLEKMLEGTGIPVHRWHSDVSHERKKALRRRPRGILLITPESLESNLINFGHQVRTMYEHVDFVVIDELHSFIESERGRHLQSLLSRIAGMVGRRPRRLALSATLADPGVAREFLNRDNPRAVRVLEDKNPRECKAVIKTIIVDETAENEASDPMLEIAEDLQISFGDATNLVFANSRRTVETLDVRLKEITLTPHKCRLHHGSLSRQVRTLTESALKCDESIMAVCTSTLELGIDIGAIEHVAQIDPPATVSALVQRVGRSGRRAGMTATLKFYIRSVAPGSEATLTDLLFPDLIRGIAMVRLLKQGWLEPQNPSRPHVSTFTHQVLSLLKQHGGSGGETIYSTLCVTGPFRSHSRADFQMLMRGLQTHDLIKIDSEGFYILTLVGEKITSRPDFYAAFASPIELAVRHGAEEIGKLPTGVGLKQGDCIILDARRWEIAAIDWKAHTAWVVPSKVAAPPVFLGCGGDVDARIHQEMSEVLRQSGTPAWLDKKSVELLQSARDAACRSDLRERNVLIDPGGIQWFPWAGSRGLRTLELCARSAGIEASIDSLSIRYPGLRLNDFHRHLSQLTADATSLARLLEHKHQHKFDQYVHSDLLDKANSVDRIDLSSALKCATHELRLVTTMPV
jgi:ATP-dependent helicase Lhr and Lhr-like helicase